MSASARAGDAPLGSAADEAGRLAEALHDWWVRREPAAAAGAADAAGDAAADGAEPAAATDETHDAHADGVCRYCPLCRGAAVLQSLRPEVVQHLLSAAESVAAALRELSREPAGESAERSDRGARPHPGHAGASAGGRRTVRIPVDGDDDHLDHDVQEGR